KLGLPIASPAAPPTVTASPGAAAVAKVEPKTSGKAAPVAKAIGKPADKLASAPPKPVGTEKPVPKVVDKPATAPAPKPVVEASGLYVQAGAYSTKARAEVVAKSIGGSVSPAGRVWRVRVGPHKDRGQAEAALAKVRAAGYADARVVTAP
ncbi:MAG: hypothetical protein B7Y31_13450, partial [Novosphingobium sp. 16-62-11]